MGKDLVLLTSSASLYVVGNPFLHSGPPMLRSGGLKVRLAQVDCVGEFKG